MTPGTLRFPLAMLLFFRTLTATAQITTASVGGGVVDAAGKPVAGAVVSAVHEPSGTQYHAVTNGDGRYAIRGMRAGGPYGIEISCLGMESEKADGLFLRLGETLGYNAVLRESRLELAGIVVTARSGTAEVMTSADIARLPSVSHGIADAIRLNPHVRAAADGTLSFIGKDNHYNSFRIDGVANNDVYGLADNGLNGGQAGTQPVSLETIGQIQIDVAPFDVRQSGFTGGSVNAVTKSGTNDFHGSVYGFGNNRSLIGNRYRLADGQISNKYADQYEYQAGATLGGPVVRNRLFFFAHYEKADKTYRNPYSLGSTASLIDGGKATELLERLKETAAAQGIAYRGDLDATDVYAKSHKAGLKLDWNIGREHKASFRWSLISARRLNSVGNAHFLNASDFSYDFVSATHSFVAELQSRFSNRLSNEFRASYVRVRDRRKPHASFPMVQIGNVGDGTLNLGNDRSSMANALDQDIWTFTDNLTWYAGKHTLALGTQNELYRFSNLFIQDAYGSYFFDSPDDFYAGRIRQYRFAQANAEVTGNPRWAAAFDAAVLGFYVQDRFGVTRSLDLTLGLRLDLPLFFDAPAENAPFNGFMASEGWAYRTNDRPNRKPLFAPRLGFRWDLDGTGRCIVRGGAGIFTGRIPFVWMGNNFANTGVQLSTYIALGPDGTKDLSLILDPAKQSQNTGRLTAAGTQIVNVFDRDFAFPQDLRADLAADFELGGIRWTAEAVCSKTLNDVFYRNLAVSPTGKTLGDAFPDIGFDRRPLMAKIEGAENYNGIYLLCNTSRGYTCSLSLTGGKTFGFGLDVTASYIWLKSVTRNNGTTSVAASNWQANYTFADPNTVEPGFSPFHVPHSVRAAVFYTKTWKRNQTTTFGLTYAGSSGIPYSVCYNGDLNGDGASNNDLIYIPTDAEADRMNFVPASGYSAERQRANFKAWLAGDDYMGKHRGQYYPRNAGRKRFEHHIDFHFSHRFDFRIGNGRRGLELSFDIVNAGNLFNRDWGQTSSSINCYNPVTYKGNGNFQFLHEADYEMHAYDDYYSRWRGQLGVRFLF